MSKSIQESLELPVLEDLLKSSSREEAEDETEITDEMVESYPDEEISTSTALANPIAQDIMEAREAREFEKAMDNIHDETIQHAKDLMDLGYNVDTRSAGRIFENAASMYTLALNAKNSKRDAQLKAKKLKLEERKQELAERGARQEAGSTTIDNEEVIIEDRNELIKQFRSQQPK